MKDEKNNMPVSQNVTDATAPAVSSLDVKELLSLPQEEVVKSGKRAGILRGWGFFQLIISCLMIVIGGFFAFTEKEPWALQVFVLGIMNILPAIVFICCRSTVARLSCIFCGMSMIICGLAGLIIGAQLGRISHVYVMPVFYGCYILWAINDEKLWGESHLAYNQLSAYCKMLKKNNVAIDKIPEAFRLDDRKDTIISILAIISELAALAVGAMLNFA